MAGGEPSSETAFDTSRLQSALNACPAGQAVELTANGTNDAFLIQPIDIPSGVTLLVDGGVTVFASRNPADYQVTGSGGIDQCGTDGPNGNGCKSLIGVNSGNTSTGSGIMGYGVIDGRGEDTLLVNGTATTQSWWDIARAASGGNSQNNPILLQMKNANNFTLYKITLKNSPMFHVSWKGTGLTAWGVKIITPYTGRNTDGIDPGGSNVTITNSSISDGDDNIAIAGSSASSNISVTNVNTYSGHGISIGSYTQGGVSNMLVDHVNFAGTTGDGNATGIRLKTAADRGGLVENITYRNICMKDIKYPLQLNPFYNSNSGTLLPQFQNITIANAHFLTEGKVQLQGYDVNHPTTLTLNNVVFDTLAQSDLTPAPENIAITLGPGPVAPAPLQTQAGTGVSYNGSVTNPAQAPYSCSANTFQYLVGELYLSTASATNQAALTTTAPGTFTLNAMLQPAMSEVMYGASTGTPAPTAAVNFMEGSTMVGTGTLGGNGTIASATLTGVTAGTHTYTAVYPGDATYAGYSFGSVTVTATPAAPVATTTTLNLGTATIYTGGAVTLTAHVSSTNGPPSGSVTFLQGTTVLTTVPLLSTSGSSANASFLYTPMTTGVENITAMYMGNSNFAASTSAPAALTVVLPIGLASVNPTSLSLAAGASGTVTASVASLGGFSGTVSFTCTSPVSYVSCALSSSSSPVSGASVATTKATIKVEPTVGELRPRPGGERGRGFYALLLPLGVLGLAGLKRRRFKMARMLPIVLLLASFAAGLSGCGSSGNPNSAMPPVGPQAVSISASVTTAAGTATRTAQVTVNVTN